MLDFNVFRVRKVFNLEEFFHLINTLSGKVHNLVLFIDNEIAGLLALHAHNGVHLA